MNQNPEQLARDIIDVELTQCGWVIQNKNQINLNTSIGIAIREYQTDIGPSDYVLFVNKQPVGIIEAKRAEEAVHLTMHEEQTEGYRTVKLKYLNNQPTNIHYTLKKNPLRLDDLKDFITYYNPKNRNKREKTYSANPELAEGPEGLWENSHTIKLLQVIKRVWIVIS